MFFVPTKLPTMTAAMTNASQPKTAVFQWLALQRPMRAAMLFERFRGDMVLSSFAVVDTTRLAPSESARNPAHRRLCGVAGHTQGSEQTNPRTASAEA